ncbi:MAG: hypothetical protein L3J59_15405, partial [Methylococcaceae bacterium]|nr:hypothetical protein [Methylococcaceae bacterium]
YYMEDIKPKKIVNINKDKMPFVKSHFTEHQINFDISDLDNLDDKKTDQHYEMMSLSQLNTKIDKLEKPYKENLQNNIKRYYNRVKAKKLVADTLDLSKYKSNILSNFNDKNKLKIFKGSGEARKYVGSYTGNNGEKLKSFFEYKNWGNTKVNGQRSYPVFQERCFFSKSNLLQYLYDHLALFFFEQCLPVRESISA